MSHLNLRFPPELQALDTEMDKFWREYNQKIHLVPPHNFGECGEAAESELNKAGVPDGATAIEALPTSGSFKAPPLSNEHSPIHDHWSLAHIWHWFGRRAK